MEFFGGLDVSMDETAICVVDDKGKVVLETAVVTDPQAIKGALKPCLGRLRRVGHEAGALSRWLHPEVLCPPPREGRHPAGVDHPGARRRPHERHDPPDHGAVRRVPVYGERLAGLLEWCAAADQLPDRGSIRAAGTPDQEDP